MEAVDSTNLQMKLLKDVIDEIIWEQYPRLLWPRIVVEKTRKLMKAEKSSVRTTTLVITGQCEFEMNPQKGGMANKRDCGSTDQLLPRPRQK